MTQLSWYGLEKDPEKNKYHQVFNYLSYTLPWFDRVGLYDYGHLLTFERVP